MTIREGEEKDQGVTQGKNQRTPKSLKGLKSPKSRAELKVEAQAYDFKKKRMHILQECRKKREVVAIYHDEDETDRFASGFVEAVTDAYVLLAHITPYGEYDGFRAFETEEIFQIKTKGQYVKKIQKLYMLRQQGHPNVEEETDSVMINLLRYAKQNQLVIALQLCDSRYDDVQGLVSEVDCGDVGVELLDDYGRPDGTCVLEIEKITRLVCDSAKQKVLKLLYQTQ